jgi:hypothetical protein
MSLEILDTLATLGTFLVIAATAIAAIIQLHHARSSNQIAALSELRETGISEELRAALHFIHTELPIKLRDPAFRYQLNNSAMRTDENRPLIGKVNVVGNFYEDMGVLVKAGLVDRKLALEILSRNTLNAWKSLAPVTAMSRREMGDEVWENFEYLAVLSQDWIAVHRKGTYPQRMRRITLKDEWRDADRDYAARLARA